MPTPLSRKVVKREFVKMRKQTRRGRFFEIGRCIITFECGHKREYAAKRCAFEIWAPVVFTENLTETLPFIKTLNSGDDVDAKAQEQIPASLK
jgi:hypothetical protein